MFVDHSESYTRNSGHVIQKFPLGNNYKSQSLCESSDRERFGCDELVEIQVGRNKNTRIRDA